MKITREKTAKPREKTKDDSVQFRNRLVFVIVIVILLGGAWLMRIPKGYVSMFLGHYVGTTSVLDSLKGLDHTDIEEAETAALQTAYDNWKQTSLKESLSITSSSDGLLLQGDFYDVQSNVTVIALHSFDGSNDGDYLYVPWYAEQGYNVFCPDLRSHGESEGFLVTWGDYESRDLVEWMDLIDEKFGPQTYILHGTDLGASAALWTADDERVAFVVAESPVVELYDAAQYMLGQQFKIPSFLMPLVDRSAKKTLPEGRSMKDFSLYSELAGVNTPILILASTTGTMVDCTEVKAFYDEYTGDKEIFLESTTHGKVYPMAKDRIDAMLGEYVSKYIN